MKQIPLTKGKFAIVDDKDYKEVSSHKWCLHDGYAVRRMPKEPSKLLYLHRVLANPSVGHQVDHTSMDRLDNRRSNLRVVTKSENMRNRTRQSNNTSGFKGVSLDKRKSFKKWRANIAVNGKQLAIGYFLSELEAAQAYNKAAVKYHGEFARLNEL